MNEKLRYLAAGFFSTLVSWAAMLVVDIVMFHGSQDPGPVATAVLGMSNWAAGMLAAYGMNRAWVFRSSSPVVAEFCRFLASRISTMVLDLVLRQVLRIIGISLWPSTVIVLAVIMVSNYMLSKRHVFGSADKEPQKATKL